MMEAVQLYFMDEIMDDKKPLKKKPAKKKPVKHADPDRCTPYNAKFHCEQVVKLMSEKGWFKCDVCRHWKIHPSTFEVWCKVHPEFNYEYKRACFYRLSFMLSMARQGIYVTKDGKFNAVLWSMLMRYDGQNTDERTVKVPGFSECENFNQQIGCVLKAFSSGKLTPKEANTLADLVTRAARIDEVTELRRKIEEIEKAVKDIDND